MSAALRPRPRMSLPMRRMALLAHIGAARQETAEAGRWVAADLQAMERSRRSILGGLNLLKTALVAAGVIWSLNASSRIGKGSRLFTIAISLLSTLRAMRKLGAVFLPPASLPGSQRQTP